MTTSKYRLRKALKVLHQLQDDLYDIYQRRLTFEQLLESRSRLHASEAYSRLPQWARDQLGGFDDALFKLTQREWTAYCVKVRGVWYTVDIRPVFGLEKFTGDYNGSPEDTKTVWRDNGKLFHRSNQS